MNKTVNHNGYIIGSDQKVADAQNRALRYGDGLFETMKVINGRILFLQDHINRLQAGMNMIGLKTNRLISAEGIRYEVNRLLTKSKLTHAHIRFAVFRAGGGKYTPATDDFEYLITAEEGAARYELNKKGWKIEVFHEHRKPVSELGTLKSSNSLLYVLAARSKKMHGCDEMVILNQKGEICEGSATNIYLLKGRKLYAPGKNSGCIPGVMRKQVIDIALRGGIEVEDEAIKPELLNAADEVFFTNTLIGVRWGLAYRDKRYFNKFSSQLLGYLNGAVQEEIVREE